MKTAFVTGAADLWDQCRARSACSQLERPRSTTHSRAAEVRPRSRLAGATRKRKFASVAQLPILGDLIAASAIGLWRGLRRSRSFTWKAISSGGSGALEKNGAWLVDQGSHFHR